MPKSFGTILDDCLELILSGQSDLEGCLARYPQHRERLRELLEPALLLRQETLTPPSADTLRRGRSRLLQAVQQGRFSRAARGPAQRVWAMIAHPFCRGRLRWVGAMATVVALLVVGGGVTAASGDAVPGDALYPVKKATERVRLAFAFSDARQARLQIGLAERRIEEMVELAERGDADSLPRLIRGLQSHLTETRKLAGVVSVDGTGSLAQRLDRSALIHLESLQYAVESAPPHLRAALADAFNLSASAYGDALESTMERVNTPLPAEGMGKIQVFAKDPPSLDLEHVFVEIREIQAHKAAGPASQWVTVVGQPVSFDLMRITEVQRFLGSRDVEPGLYTQIRFAISRVIAVAEGKEHAVEVPGGVLALVRPFRVEEGQTTSLLLDWDGARSLLSTGAGQFSLRPRVALHIQMPLMEMHPRDAGPTQIQDRPGERDTVERQLERAEFEGAIERIERGSWLIRGHKVEVTAQTQIGGIPAVGLPAIVELELHPDGSFIATEINVVNE
ncbi:MAG: DUF4382 domain-containing protein [Chloroflexi bacterium]|nr:DUF4382 domain-containing protein [Chloroflexota bacterium]